MVRQIIGVRMKPLTPTYAPAGIVKIVGESDDALL
jgi:hypothetical protein